MPTIKNWVGNPYQTSEGKKEVAKAMTDAVAIWKTGVNPPNLILYSNNLVVSQATVFADLVEAAFDGYNRIITNPLPFVDSHGTPMLGESDPSEFIAGVGIVITDTVYGWAMLDGNSGKLIAVENFDAPFSFLTHLDTLSLSWRWYLNGQNPNPSPGS
jgi:hypothetical protein